MLQSPRFETERLCVEDWRRLRAVELSSVVLDVLTEPVTTPLPPGWRGPYDRERARGWLREREAEGTTLLISTKEPSEPVGFMFLFVDETRGGPIVRLGYLLREASWGQGLGSELIGGLVGWCRRHSVRSIVGGVARANVASARVLEKNGFVLVSDDQSEEDVFERRL